jgi:hypothetical protein
MSKLLNEQLVDYGPILSIHATSRMAISAVLSETVSTLWVSPVADATQDLLAGVDCR